MLSESAFGLGAKSVAAVLFSSNTDGSFASSGNRFAYDQSTGNLYYDAQGNASPTKMLIATLTAHPTVAASDLSFFS